VTRKLTCKTLSVHQLNSSQKREMFHVFEKYYNNIQFKQFEDDLLKKDTIFLLLDKATKTIQGFSTLVHLKALIDGKEVHGLFSGDTVIEKKYWGQGVLGKAFLKELFLTKIKRPWKPLYWFLISKGYKTYLLMANNFGTHYPRFEKETPKKFKKIIDSFGNILYPKNYSEKTGTIVFNQKDCLKEHVAPITKEMLENKRIHFFNQNNPQWSEGTELACLSEMTITMPFKYQIKYFYKVISKLNKKWFMKTRKQQARIS
jgi:hypothetical protein